MYISIDDLGDVVRSSHTGRKYEVMELGLLQPHQVPLDSLLAILSIFMLHTHPFFILSVIIHFNTPYISRYSSFISH